MRIYVHNKLTFFNIFIIIQYCLINTNRIIMYIVIIWSLYQILDGAFNISKRVVEIKQYEITK
jgi:hypothetical protein